MRRCPSCVALAGYLAVALGLSASITFAAGPSVARQWNEQLLHAISLDTARPTVHARNLFHVSAAMYDAWAAYDPTAAGFASYEKRSAADVLAARNEAISYAAYGVMRHRFVAGPAGVGPGAGETAVDLDFQMSLLGYDPGFTSTAGNSPAAVGNRIAQAVIARGLADGANEAGVYANPPGYEPINPPLFFEQPGAQLIDPNRWQPLHFSGQRIDQFGRPIAEATQRNLTPFWGQVAPFAMTPADRSAAGLYHDQGGPPGLGSRPDHDRFKSDALELLRLSSELDPGDGVLVDISPASRGNNPNAPFTESYDGPGHALNPATGAPYAQQLAARGDYLRVISEFWADGPHSTAPPGHWNEIRNYVTDRMEALNLPKRIGGIGPVVDDLEWDIKGMFALNGGLHDAAIAAWGHKGYYDSSRPITFIRYMGGLGQSSDPAGASYHPDGLPLEPGLVELVTAESTLPGGRHEHLAGKVGKVAVHAWSGPIDGVGPFTDPNDLAGADWILAEEWMPYQLSSFVTPPFPGYVSGHSTFSRTGAEVLTQLTGSEYFPGGLGEFAIPQGSGLGFEYGPSEALSLQWATYFDASDEASLSRLSGGIHPSADDFPGRRIGHEVGLDAWRIASAYFAGAVVPEPASLGLVAPLLVLIPALGARRRAMTAAPLVAAVGLVGAPSSGAPSFVNVTSQVGITHVQSGSGGTQVMTGGVAAGDYDRDGLIDLFFTRPDAPNVLYRNTGVGFVDVSASSGFTVASPSNGVASGDIDNDGDLDLYVVGSESDRHFLYLNDGAGHFTEEAMSRGAAVSTGGASINRRGQGVALGDYDGDGWLDILTTDHSRPTGLNGSRLLRNLGGTSPGHFQDVTHAAGLDAYRPALAVTSPPNAYRFQPQFADLDADGRQDIVISADSRTSQLFWNNGDGTFSDGTLAAGVGTDKSGMGTALGDYDLDGDLDWFVTAIYDTTFLGSNPGNRLFRNNGNRSFTDVTSAAGVRATGPGLSWGWGTTFFDYDNDGDLDLAATNGFVAGYTGDRTTLWRNNGPGLAFSDVSAAAGVTDTGQGRGLIHLDYDRDGDLDLVIANYAAAPILYRNDGGNDLSWLRVEVEGALSNRDGIGAVLRVTPTEGSPTQTLTIGSGSSYLSQSELAAYFGLGASPSGTVELVEVSWPASGITQRYRSVPARSTLRVVERLLGDFNDDGVVDAADYTVWQDAVASGDSSGADDVGPEGPPDGVVDQLDLAAWRSNYGLTAPITSAVTSQAPEPHAAILVLFAGAATVGASRRSSKRRRACLPAVQGVNGAALRGALALLAVVGSAFVGSAGAVDVWLTTGDKSQLLKQQVDVVFKPGSGAGGTAVGISPGTTFQTIEGFGAAMTDSSAWLLDSRMSGAQRDKLMRQLFSPDRGIGLNYLRVPLGASDFTSSTFYTYNDSPPGGSDDLQHVVPRLQQARSLNPALRLMASPWTAPAWMKTNNALTGGSLAPQWEASYARYLLKSVQAFEAQGLPIDSLTLQNEPLHTSNYPTMSMPALQQARLFRDHVGPLFEAQQPGTKLIAYDHNWDDTTYPLQVLGDPAANAYVDGVAFHAYAGVVSAQTTVHNAFPDKGIYFTEITGGEWATNFADNLVWNFQNIIIGNLRNWGKTAIFWNIALDQNGDPHRNGCDGCRGVVTVNNVTGETTFNEEFYALGQVTRAVQAGAARVNSTSTASLNTVAFVNPDGSRAVIALNPTAASVTARFVEAGNHFSFTIPAKSAATFRWGDDGADFDNGDFDEGGFQSGGGSLDAWNVFGAMAGNVSASSEAVLTGDKSLKLFGQFSGNANTSGVSQGITVEEDQLVTASLSTLVRSSDSLAGTSNRAEAKIEFYRVYGAVHGSTDFLGERVATIASGGAAEDSWTSSTLRGIVPAGAVEARLVLQFVQLSGQSGAVYVDSIALTTSLAGDFNGDGLVDAADYSVWRDTLGSSVELAADGNADGVVDQADYDVWRRSFGRSAIELPNAVPELSSFGALGISVLSFSTLARGR